MSNNVPGIKMATVFIWLRIGIEGNVFVTFRHFTWIFRASWK